MKFRDRLFKVVTANSLNVIHRSPERAGGASRLLKMIPYDLGARRYVLGPRKKSAHGTFIFPPGYHADFLPSSMYEGAAPFTEHASLSSSSEPQKQQSMPRSAEEQPIPPCWPHEGRQHVLLLGESSSSVMPPALACAPGRERVEKESWLLLVAIQRTDTHVRHLLRS